MKEKNLIVTHSNKLTEARYSLSVNEQRIILFMISLIQPNDDNLKDYEIAINEFTELLSLNTKDTYARTKHVLQELLSRVLYIPKSDNKGYLMTHWVSSAEYKDNEGVICLSFDKKLKPYLLSLKEQFTKYRLFTVAHFGSSYSIRIYMLLKQYESIGVREFELTAFKELLDLGDKYPRFADFRKRVIDTAKLEFTKKNDSGGYVSDITFDLKTTRHNRKISRLIFTIRKQKVGSQQIELPIVKDDTNIPNIITEYETYGVSRSITLPQLEQQGEQALIDCLALFKEQVDKLDLKNPSGYLLGMLNNEAGKKDQAKQEKEERQRKEAQAKQAAERQRKLEQQRKKLEVTFIKQAKQDYISGLSEQEKVDLLEEARKAYEDNPAILNMIKDINSPIVEGYLTPKIPNLEERKEAYIKKNLKL